MDHLVVLWCAPNDSVMNKVERVMRAFNLGLAHVALTSRDVPKCSEEAVKNCSNMAYVWTVTNSWNRNNRMRS